MVCSRCHETTARHFDGRMAKADLKRFHAHGLDVTTRGLLELLPDDLGGPTALDVGGGLGLLGLELLRLGAHHVTVVDLSQAYLDAAKELYTEEGRDTQFTGVCVDLATVDSPPKAGVVTLDRVVCCYPDFETLLTQSARSADRMLLLSFPRDRWFVRLMVRLQNLFRRVRGNRFRTFVHSPAAMDAVLRAAGFSRTGESLTPVWVCQRWDRAG